MNFRIEIDSDGSLDSFYRSNPEEEASEPGSLDLPIYLTELTFTAFETSFDTLSEMESLDRPLRGRGIPFFNAFSLRQP